MTNKWEVKWDKKVKALDQERTVRNLFILISENSDNDDEIIAFLQDFPKLKPIVNAIPPQNQYEESMLMWAVWRLKTKVVDALVKAGAEVNYRTTQNESVATYWDDERIGKSEQAMIKACQIVRMLEKAHAKLDRDADDSTCIVKRAKERNLVDLVETLQALGYK